MAVNKIDYDVLAQGSRFYKDQADVLEGALNALKSMNGELQAGWTNQTSDAFIDRFNNEHTPALQSAIDALNNISSYITNYVQNRQEEDSESAAGIGG